MFPPRWSLETRLVVAFTLVVAAALVVVGIAAAVQLEGYFRDQERAELESRVSAVLAVVESRIEAATLGGRSPIVDPSGVPSAEVEEALGSSSSFLTDVADLIAQGDVSVTIEHQAKDGTMVPAGSFAAAHTSRVSEGQSRQDLSVADSGTLEDTWYVRGREEPPPTVRVEVAITGPYTFRDRSVQTVRGLLLLVGAIVLGFAFVFSFGLAGRLTSPVTRLTQASRRLAAGELQERVPVDPSGPRELVELSQQFNTMAERLEQSIRLIQEDRDRSRDFLADVSHELRTPIAALRTYNELLRDGADLDAPTRGEFLRSSAEQIERLDWLATNLLELSKLDRGLVTLDLRPNDLRAAAESALEGAAPSAERKGVALQARLPTGPVRTRHDQQRVGQLLSNLLGNAIKFTPSGGSVTLTLARNGEGGVLRISDTGIGIEAAELPHIFERFYRGTRAADARATGSGLGLAIVKSIVDMHRGVITVDSSPERGTTIEVRLPRDPEAATVTDSSSGRGRR